MIPILDIHTHNLAARQALIAVDPRCFDPQPGLYYSVGFHPWHGVDLLTDDDYALLERCARHPRVLAIGETGMDRLRGAALDVQRDVFVRHLQLAHDLGKPVVAHCVRTAQDILAARHASGLDVVTLIIHGMRGNAHVARMLLDGGCYLSYGERFNRAAVAVTPLDRLLIETDDGPATIAAVACQVAAAFDQAPATLLTRVAATTTRLVLKTTDIPD